MNTKNVIFTLFTSLLILFFMNIIIEQAEEVECERWRANASAGYPTQYANWQYAQCLARGVEL